MQFEKMQKRALEIREKFQALEKEKYGKEWTREQIVQALVGDVGGLMKAVMAKEGVREIDDADERLAYELTDCLWSVIVIADKYGVDLESKFKKNMDQLEKEIG